MQTLLSRYTCWRHGKGFGIHSPFAYSFITEVLRQHLHYYGYADISSDRRIRLLFRLIIFFKPERVKIISSQPALLESAVRRASGKVVIVDSDPDFLVADAADTNVHSLIPTIEAGVNALILNASRDDRAKLCGAGTSGMLFDNRHGTIVIAAQTYLPRQNFDVKF